MGEQKAGKSRKVAEFNPSPRWPQGYLQVLEEMGVEERRRGFYAHWVRQFFNRCKGRRRRRDLGRSDIDRFLGILRDQGGVEDWQVEQARKALEIYYEQFRGIALDPPRASQAGGQMATPDTDTGEAPEPADGPKRRERPAQTAAAAPKAETPRPVPTPRVPSQPTSVPRPTPPRTPRSPQQQSVDWVALEKAARTALRVEHYAMKTEKAYLHWIRQFVGFHHGRRPSEMGGPEIHAFLSHLAINRQVGPPARKIKP